MDRHMNDGDFCWRVIGILRTFNWRQRLKYLLVLPLVLVPVPFSFWVRLRAMIYRLKKVPAEDVPPLRLLHRG